MSKPTSIVGLVIAILLIATACVGGQIPEPPLAANGEPDPALVAGRDVWADNCVRCHGASGDGGRGPRLSEGRVVEKYPDENVQVSVVVNGLNGRMPGFRNQLTDEETANVVAYTRAAL